jgi:cytochrome c oxidase cbb3-type subunit 4
MEFSQGDWMALATLLAFVALWGVGVWAFSSSRKAGFEEAAQLPFADEPAGRHSGSEKND